MIRSLVVIASPPKLSAMRVWLSFRFPLSLRMVEGMLAARGIVVSPLRANDGET